MFSLLVRSNDDHTDAFSCILNILDYVVVKMNIVSNIIETIVFALNICSTRMSVDQDKRVYPKQCMFWKWRDGGAGACPPPERSPVPIYANRVQAQVQVQAQAQVQVQTQPQFSLDRRNNTREDSCTKMGEREMVRQVGMNPFLNTDYVKGIEIRDKFLVPYHESKPSYDGNTVSLDK
jgi:hypothetical protein